MKHPRLLLAAPAAFAWLAALAQAQTATPPAAAPAAPAASTAASAPAPGKPPRRALPADKLRDSGSFPGELRPEEPAKPQIAVPLGRKPPAPSAAVSRAVQRDKASPGKVNDQLARCKGQAANADERAACDAEPVASEAKGR